MANKRKIILFPVGGMGVVEEVDLTLANMQAMVGGGSIQMVPYRLNGERRAHIELVCNEDGKSNGLEPNRPAWGGTDLIFGPFFFVGAGDDEGVSTGLSDDQIAALRAEFDV